MSVNLTTIEWAEHTWNPLRGCTHATEGCRHCYAERLAARFSGPGAPFHGFARTTPQGPRWTGEVALVESALDEPRLRRKPSLIFACSMSDLFHERVPDEWIDRIFAAMAACPQHTFLVLTKRADRARRYLKAPLPNVGVGVSCEDQHCADRRIPALLATPAAMRFVSLEPLLGPIDLQRWLGSGATLDWVILGGESGPGARAMHPDWVRAIRDQCIATDTPFFFKQWGGAFKRRAGRILDGRTWDGVPPFLMRQGLHD